MSEFTNPIKHRLHNGVEIPSIGFGCAFGNWTDTTEGKFVGFQPDLGYFAIPAAVRAGYSHFDSAYIYGSHRILGATLGSEMAKGRPRSDFFVTTKVFHPATAIALNNIQKSFDFSDPTLKIKQRVMFDFEKSLDELSFGYVDLLLMHWPGDFGSTDEAVNRQRRKECWEAFEEIYASGKARAIGVSNFQIRHLETLIEDSTVAPMVNQIEINPFIQQKETVAYCQAHGVHCTAWAPFGSGATGVLEDPVIADIAQRHGRSVGQVILRWLVQLEMSVLPKSSSESRMKSNLDIAGFTLTDADMEAIAALDKNKSSVVTSDDIA